MGDGPRHGRDRFHTVPIFALVRNDFMKGNMEIRAHQAYPPTHPPLERRQEKFGTRMERVPTARWVCRALETQLRLCSSVREQNPLPLIAAGGLRHTRAPYEWLTFVRNATTFGCVF